MSNSRQETVVMDSDEIRRAVTRIAHEIIERNKKLTILNRNCLCGISKEDCKRKPPDEKSMQNLFKELEFKSLMRNVTHKNSDNAGYGQGVLFGA